ncbi:MAG: hypothetical protein ABSC23_21855 [Bryobacteraceae bacterium]|jgi:hypothetical protein
MTFQWLDMRITEEQERRQRETLVRERLPSALEEWYGELSACVDVYRSAFGPESAEIRLEHPRITVTIREERDGQWQPRTEVAITTAPKLPGFQIDGCEDPFTIEIGMLPGHRLFYKSEGQFLTNEDVTRRILDRALFPKLGQ